FSGLDFQVPTNGSAAHAVMPTATVIASVFRRLIHGLVVIPHSDLWGDPSTIKARSPIRCDPHDPHEREVAIVEMWPSRGWNAIRAGKRRFRKLASGSVPGYNFPVTPHIRPISARYSCVPSLRAIARILVRRLETRSRQRRGAPSGKERRNISSRC